MVWVCVVFVWLVVVVAAVCAVVGMSGIVAIVTVACATATQISVVLYGTLSWNLQVVQE